MPRLPRLLVEGTEAPSGGARIPMSAADNGSGAFAQAAQSIGHTLGQFAELEREKKNVAIRQETALLGADLEREVASGLSDLQLTTRDPDEYRERAEKLVDDTAAVIRKRAKNGEAAAAFDTKMARYIAEQKAQAFKHSNLLFRERGAAQLDETLNARKGLAGLAPDDETFNRQMKEGLAAIDAAIPLIGEAKATDEKQKFKEDLLGARAYAESQATPAAFLESADSRYADLDPKKREELKVSAAAKVESDRKSRNAEWESYYKRMEDEAERERTTQLTALTARAESGELTIAQLEEQRAMRVIERPSEYTALRRAIEQGAQDNTPSDPTVLTDVQIRSRAPVPRITSGELDRLFMAGKLNRKDWLAEKEKVQGRLDHLKSEGRTERNQEQAQAEQVLKAGLGLTAPQDKWDEQDGQLYARALDELTARAFGPNASERPLDVAREIGLRMAPIRQERLTLKVEDYRRSLPLDVRAPTAMEAVKKLDEAIKRGRINPSTYEVHKRTILDWVRQEMADEAKKSGESGGGQSSGSQSSGGGKSLRKK